MSGDLLVNVSERWFRLLQRLYPPDFRDDMGEAVVETYRDRAREALRRGGILRLAVVWMRAVLSRSFSSSRGTLNSAPSEGLKFTQVGHSDPVIHYGMLIDQRIRATQGIN